MIRLYEMNLFVQMIELGYILRFENRLERMFFVKLGFERPSIIYWCRFHWKINAHRYDTRMVIVILSAPKITSLLLVETKIFLFSNNSLHKIVFVQ